MLVYHVTSAADAAAIDAAGFPEDNDQLMCLGPELTGVWVCDRPVLDLAPYDDPVVFELDVPDAALSGREVFEEGRSYREWLLSASSLNAARRRRVALPE